ncbi:hypothetical protein GH714_013962 [Hevea brasiliensis]|uniref:Gamma-tubulin complex component n=1 Tax=Hevea brasiliensis TaxID=3981 RepID=A0A6A6LGH0_HEVBR|nr:hypothetical protein GH714_013962 [Hevea brasiliensis]
MSAQAQSALFLGDGIHYATPIISSTRTSEVEVVRGVLRMMQGLSSSLFYWDQIKQSFCVARSGIYVTHLSLTSLQNLLNQFLYSATCLQLVQVNVNRLELETRMPTLRAFASAVTQWLKRLRDIALKEEIKMCNSNIGITPTVLGLSSSLSSLCSGAECLLQIVHGAIPQAYFQPNSSIPASEMAVHILDYLYKKLDEVCLVQGGEEEAYLMVLHILVGSLLPYIEGLDSWIFKGTLDDPFEEVKEQNKKELQLCPLFIKNLAKSIVSAGKSLQLIRHVPMFYSVLSGKSVDNEIDGFGGSEDDKDINSQQQSIAGLALPEIFSISVAGLIGHVKGTNYAFGFQFGKSEYLRSQEDIKLLEVLFPFPTLLPSIQDDICMSGLLPFQKNSTLASRVDYIGHLMLSKLMKDWRLTDELGVLRAIYLLGSGDLLQHFLTVIFRIHRNSADSMLLSAPDSLFVSIIKNHGFDGDELPISPTLASTTHKSRPHSFGMMVSWPLELIANAEAINKYNQVMRFLLKVKRAKYALDKVRRWMWKGRGAGTNSHKHHWLVEQKLLHFVDAFHQYVMDRVYHSAWHELCEGMATAGSLDEVIEWALIASRINMILGLALDFYSIQQTLSSGSATSAMKARCEMEVDRIEKRFDDCIAFLLRILSFKLNGGNSSFGDLVTRINYNYFYMSDNGSLKTATGSETVSSRLGKVFGARMD